MTGTSSRGGNASRSQSERFDQAAADYEKAERLGSREQVFDFQAHCVVDCTKADAPWAEALWYLDRLISACPDDGECPDEDGAAVCGKLGREADRQAELARVFELGGRRGTRDPTGRGAGWAGRWPEAAGLLARCGRTGPLSQGLAQAWVIACLKASDSAGYREACEAFMTCQGPNPTVVWSDSSAATLFTPVGAGGRAITRCQWDGLKAGYPRCLGHHPCTGTCSRPLWADCCFGPAGATRRSPG